MLLDHFQEGPPELRTKFNRMVDILNAVLNARGDGTFINLRLTPEALLCSLNIAQIPPRIPKMVSGGQQMLSAMVRIKTAASQGGVYNGVVLVPPAADVPAGSNLAAADMGTEGETILILNCKEEGKTTHDLLDAANTFDFDAPAVYLRTNSDGVKVYAIDKVVVVCDDDDSTTDGGTW